MIDYNALENALASAINLAIGSFLATDSQGVPAIVYYGSGEELSQYPYVVIQRGNTLPIQGTNRLDRYLDDTDSVITTKQKQVQYFLRVCGSNSVDANGNYNPATSICSQLQNVLDRSSVRESYNLATSGSEIAETLGITTNWTVVDSNQTLENATLSILLNTIDVDTEALNSDLYLLEYYTLNGSVYKHQEDQNPENITITTVETT